MRVIRNSHYLDFLWFSTLHLLMVSWAFPAQETSQLRFDGESFRLRFSGNRIFSQQELFAAMDLQVMDTVTPASDLGLDEVNKARERAREFMANKGYLISEISDPVFDRSHGSPTLTFSVKEGPLFRLGRVEFTGATVFSPEQLRVIYGLRSGDIAAAFVTRQRQAIERLKTLYGDQGYLLFTIEVRQDFHDEEGLLDCAFHIQEGPIFSIRHLVFAGANPEKEWILRDQFSLVEGQVFSWKRLEEGLARLHQLGLIPALTSNDVVLKLDEIMAQVDVTVPLNGKN